MVRILLAASVVVFLPTKAFAIPSYSLDDPSLEGTEIASTRLYLESAIPGGGPGSPPIIFDVDEKVVQTQTGNLDFYYRFISPYPVQLSTFNVGAINYIVTDPPGYVADDPGTVAPVYSNILVAGAPDSPFYATYGFADSTVDAAGTHYLLLRSATKAYASDGFISVSIDDGPYESTSGAFIPDAPVVPEPGSMLLIPLCLMGLAWRFRAG